MCLVFIKCLVLINQELGMHRFHGECVSVDGEAKRFVLLAPQTKIALKIWYTKYSICIWTDYQAAATTSYRECSKRINIMLKYVSQLYSAASSNTEEDENLKNRKIWKKYSNHQNVKKCENMKTMKKHKRRQLGSRVAWSTKGHKCWDLSPSGAWAHPRSGKELSKNTVEHANLAWKERSCRKINIRYKAMHGPATYTFWSKRTSLKFLEIYWKLWKGV